MVGAVCVEETQQNDKRSQEEVLAYHSQVWN